MPSFDDDDDYDDDDDDDDDYYYYWLVGLPGFCFTPYTSVLIQGTVFDVSFTTKRSHLVISTLLRTFFFVVFSSLFPSKI